jgi:hypothetical protein
MNITGIKNLNGRNQPSIFVCILMKFVVCTRIESELVNMEENEDDFGVLSVARI